MASFTAADLAQRLDGEVLGDASLVLTGFAPVDRARPGDLVFAENESYFSRANAGGGSAILCPPGFTSEQKTLIRVKNARVAYARLLPLFFPEAPFKPGTHPSAAIAPSAIIDPSAHIGPHCVIGERVKIGARTVLLGGNHVGDDSQIGEDTRIFPNVVLYGRTQIGNHVRIHAGTVIGSDGFGYVQDEGQHRKVLQLGSVIIGDDVEIGANVTVDRGALGPTAIGRGTKIDNLVQIAHNVVMGENCLVIAQVGIAGSAKLGNYVIVAGQAGIGGHITIGNRVTVAGQSGVMNNVPDGGKVFGTPAYPVQETKRQMVALRSLPKLLQRVAALEKKLAELAPPT